MKNIVISIKNDNESRRNHVINEFKKSNVDFEFFDAITPEQILSVKPVSIYLIHNFHLEERVVY